MSEDRERLLKHYRRTRQELLAVIHGLSESALTEHSLDGWSVKDHLAHLAVWDDIRASEVDRISAGHASAWRMSGELDEAYNAIAYELRQNLSLGQIRWELEKSRERLLTAIASVAPRGLDASRYGEAVSSAGTRRGTQAGSSAGAPKGKPDLLDRVFSAS